MKTLGARLGSILAAAAMGAVLVTAPAAAQADPAPQAPRPAGKLHRCLSILDLSDTQKADLKKVFEAARPALAQLHEKAKADREALRAALDRNPADPCAVGAAAIAVDQDHSAFRDLRERLKAAVDAILTTDQKAKLAGCLEAPPETPLPGDPLGDEPGLE